METHLLVGRHYVVYSISQHETATKRRVIFLQIVMTNLNMVFFDYTITSLNLWTVMIALEHGIWSIWNLLSSSKLSLQTFLWTGSLFSCYVVSWMSLNSFFSSQRHLMHILYMRSSWKKKNRRCLKAKMGKPRKVSRANVVSIYGSAEPVVFESQKQVYLLTFVRVLMFCLPQCSQEWAWEVGPNGKTIG